MERSFRTNLIDAIMDQASQDEKIVVLNADSARALCLTKFAETYPERMINVGISETDLIGTAAGLATTGLKPLQHIQVSVQARMEHHISALKISQL